MRLTKPLDLLIFVVCLENIFLLQRLNQLLYANKRYKSKHKTQAFKKLHLSLPEVCLQQGSRALELGEHLV